MIPQLLNGGGTRRGAILTGSIFLCCLFALALTFHTRRAPPHGLPPHGLPPHDLPPPGPPPVSRPVAAPGSKFNPDAAPVACRGARGGHLDDPNSPDLPHGREELPGTAFPDSTTGSYEALGLEKSWMTIDDRYGPYGYREDEQNYTSSKVDWSKINWGQLQHDCLVANSARYGEVGELERVGRFRGTQGEDIVQAPGKSGRQAVVLRTWSTYNYMPEDMWNIRSIISEASLASSGAYDVILLVDVKDKKLGPLIHKDDAAYREVLEDSVPEEFWDLAILFWKDVQKDWYAKVDEFQPMWQIMQPLQLLAHFYPEYDHFWQFELDARFTGDVGKMLRAFDKFGKDQPYKQSRERASWGYIPELHGTYEHFSSLINKTMKGGATTWGPLDVDPSQPPAREAPPMHPYKDNFEWGVGSDADLLLPNTLLDVKRIEKGEDWVFRDWVKGGLPPNPPRFLTVPAQARASWELLEAAHRAQHLRGVAVPSEATLPSFALWHGMKLVGLPIPNFQFPQREVHELNLMFNGGYPRDYPDGLAYGPAHYRAHFAAWFLRPTTWDWWSSICDSVFDHWMQQEPRKGTTTKDKVSSDPRHPVIPPDMPYFMAEFDGKVYSPAFMMHPRKTNSYIA